MSDPMRDGRYIRLLAPWLFPVFLLLSACAATPPAPEDHHYRLVGGQPAPRLSRPALDGTLKIDPIQAYGIYRERALLYSLEAHPETLLQHRYHYWIDTPTRLIRDQLIDFLRTSGVARQVTGSRATLPADLRLKLTLKQFERVLHEDGTASVRVALDGVITGSDGLPLKHLAYTLERPVAGDSIAASVKAFSQALSGIQFEILQDLRTL